MKKYNVISSSLYALSYKKKYVRYFTYLVSFLFVLMMVYTHLLQWYRWRMLRAVYVMHVDHDKYQALYQKKEQLEAHEKHIHQQMVKHDKLRAHLKKQQQLLQVLTSNAIAIESFSLVKKTCDVHCSLPLYVDAKDIVRKLKKENIFDTVKLVSFSQKSASCSCHIHGTLL